MHGATEVVPLQINHSCNFLVHAIALDGFASILKETCFPTIPIWHFHLNSFGLMLWFACVAAAFVMDRGFKRAGIGSYGTGTDAADAVGMVAIAMVAGIVGAKLWHVIDTPIEFREMGWRVLWDTAGFAWFGGLLFGISALVFQGWWAKIGGCGRWISRLRRRPLDTESGASAAFFQETAATGFRPIFPGA
jgi:hypothetical protein